jgi:hypothetical protein
MEGLGVTATQEPIGHRPTADERGRDPQADEHHQFSPFSMPQLGPQGERDQSSQSQRKGQSTNDSSIASCEPRTNAGMPQQKQRAAREQQAYDGRYDTTNDQGEWIDACAEARRSDQAPRSARASVGRVPDRKGKDDARDGRAS